MLLAVIVWLKCEPTGNQDFATLIILFPMLKL